MDVTVIVSEGHRTVALIKALEAYNASNDTITEQQFVQKMIDGQLDGLVAAYLVTKLTKLEFLNRMTAEERISIREAAKVSPAIHDYMAMLDAAQDVDLTDGRTIGGVQTLEVAGLIGEGRAAEILAL